MPSTTNGWRQSGNVPASWGAREIAVVPQDVPQGFPYTVEQLVLICVVSLPLAVAFLYVGARWLELYLYQRRVLGFPLP